MKYDVFFISDAEEDLLEIFNYSSRELSKDSAEKIIRKLEKSCQELEKFPTRGHIPPELDRITVMSYKEIHCSPYRIIYEIRQTAVYIHCILYKNRDLQEILLKRLLR